MSDVNLRLNQQVFGQVQKALADGQLGQQDLKDIEAAIAKDGKVDTNEKKLLEALRRQEHVDIRSHDGKAAARLDIYAPDFTPSQVSFVKEGRVSLDDGHLHNLNLKDALATVASLQNPAAQAEQYTQLALAHRADPKAQKQLGEAILKAMSAPALTPAQQTAFLNGLNISNRPKAMELARSLVAQPSPARHEYQYQALSFLLAPGAQGLDRGAVEKLVNTQTSQLRGKEAEWAEKIKGLAAAWLSREGGSDPAFLSKAGESDVKEVRDQAYNALKQAIKTGKTDSETLDAFVKAVKTSGHSATKRFEDFKLLYQHAPDRAAQEIAGLLPKLDGKQELAAMRIVLAKPGQGTLELASSVLRAGAPYSAGTQALARDYVLEQAKDDPEMNFDTLSNLAQSEDPAMVELARQGFMQSTEPKSLDALEALMNDPRAPHLKERFFGWFEAKIKAVGKQGTELADLSPELKTHTTTLQERIKTNLKPDGLEQARAELGEVVKQYANYQQEIASYVKKYQGLPNVDTIAASYKSMADQIDKLTERINHLTELFDLPGIEQDSSLPGVRRELSKMEDFKELAGNLRKLAEDYQNFGLDNLENTEQLAQSLQDSVEGIAQQLQDFSENLGWAALKDAASTGSLARARGFLVGNYLSFVIKGGATATGAYLRLVAKEIALADQAAALGDEPQRIPPPKPGSLPTEPKLPEVLTQAEKLLRIKLLAQEIMREINTV